MEDLFLRHEQCPRCKGMGRDRSGNNLGVWENHKYCFSCGYYESDNPLNLKGILDNKKKNHDDTSISLPYDCVDLLPERCVVWLDNYGLTDGEQEKFLWSEQFERLIYPVYDDNNHLVFFQGRKFPSKDKKHAKYLTAGLSQKVYLIICPPERREEWDRIIVVEDVVSALKVGRQDKTMPLWGSQIGPERLKTLSDRFRRLWIWLDKDKAQYSLKTRLNASLYFDEVRSIITEKDPKEYSDKEIKEILNGNNP